MCVDICVYSSIPKNDTIGLLGGCLIIRNCETVFQCGYIILNSLSDMRVPGALYFPTPNVLNFSTSGGRTVVSTGIVICIFQRC